MQQYNLKLPKRGTRDYIHSTDLFNETLLRIAEGEKNLSEKSVFYDVYFKISLPIKRSVRLLILNKSSERHTQSCAEIRMKFKDENYFCYLSSAKSPPANISNDLEHYVVETAQIDKDSVTVKGDTLIPTMSSIIFGNKLLCQQKSTRKKFWFCAIAIKRLPWKFRGKIEIGNYFESENGTTRSAICLDHEEVGTIFFKAE